MLQTSFLHCLKCLFFFNLPLKHTKGVTDHEEAVPLNVSASDVPVSDRYAKVSLVLVTFCLISLIWYALFIPLLAMAFANKVRIELQYYTCTLCFVTKHLE